MYKPLAYYELKSIMAIKSSITLGRGNPGQVLPLSSHAGLRLYFASVNGGAGFGRVKFDSVLFRSHLILNGTWVTCH